MRINFALCGFRNKQLQRGKYFKHVRRNIISEIELGPNVVLDVGCAEGATGRILKASGLASFVVGVELNSDAARVAKDALDEVICGDIETMDFNESFMAPEAFDYILLGDILEHLRDPWNQLSKLMRLLAPNGKVIISVPNVRHWRIICRLLFCGRWTYEPSGIMDINHLRFFTRYTAVSLIKDAGLVVVSCKPNFGDLQDMILYKMSLGLLSEIFVTQWIITARKNLEII